LAADGVTVRSTSSYNQQVGFTGRYLDKETGLWYFRARYYSASLSNFISRDPLGYYAGYDLYDAQFIPNMLDPEGLAPYNWIVQNNPSFGDTTIGIKEHPTCICEDGQEKMTKMELELGEINIEEEATFVVKDGAQGIPIQYQCKLSNDVKANVKAHEEKHHENAKIMEERWAAKYAINYNSAKECVAAKSELAKEWKEWKRKETMHNNGDPQSPQPTDRNWAFGSCYSQGLCR